MPAIAWFTVSRQVLVDPFLAGGTSAINILDTVVAQPYQVPEDAPDEYRKQYEDVTHALPPVMGCAQWIRQPDDDDSQMEAQLVIVAPDGKPTAVNDTVTPFRPSAPMHATIMLTPFIGLRLEGLYRFIVQCRAEGAEWQDHAEFRFLVMWQEHMQQISQQAQEAVETAQEPEIGSERRRRPTRRKPVRGPRAQSDADHHGQH